MKLAFNVYGNADLKLRHISRVEESRLKDFEQIFQGRRRFFLQLIEVLKIDLVQDWQLCLQLLGMQAKNVYNLRQSNIADYHFWSGP